MTQTKPRSAEWYGWKPDLPDHRDLVYSVSRVTLPDRVDLRSKLPKCWNQGNLGSCTGHGVGAAIAFLHHGFMPSRLMLYYDGRALEGTISNDDGAQIRDVVKGAHQKGVCNEKLWPYKIGDFAKKPSVNAGKDAKTHLIKSYHRVPINLQSLKTCLSDGFPYVFGFSVFESFESDAIAKTGIMSMPGTNEQMLGGHCVLAVGYNDANKSITVRNSWGVSWGDKGHFYMPYDFMTNNNYCDDLWTIRV